MNVTHETTLAEATEAPLRLYRKGKIYATHRSRGAGICAGAFGVFALLGFNAKPSVNLPLICFAAAAWGAGLFLLVYKDSVRRRITRYVASELKGPWPRTSRWEIQARQLICTSAGLTYTYNLADLTGVHEDGRWLELSFGERTSCVLPLRAFADTEEKARFLAAVGQPPARPTEG